MILSEEISINNVILPHSANIVKNHPQQTLLKIVLRKMLESGPSDL